MPTVQNVSISNDDSILTSIKKLLGLESDYTPFDADILMYINGILLDLEQIGVSPLPTFFLTSEKETWLDFSKDERLLNAIKPYVYLKVKLIFDPPASSTVLSSFERMAEKFEWRINMAIELAKEVV